MRKVRVLTILMCLLAAYSMGGDPVDISNGKYNAITYTINSHVRVDYNSPQTGTTVELKDGGYIDYYLDAYYDSKIIVSGGYIRDTIRALNNAQVTVSGGTIRWHLLAEGNNTITLSGGSIGQSLNIGNASIATITGGNIGDSIHVSSNSQLFFSGATIGASMTVSGNSRAIMTGGAIGTYLEPSDNSNLMITGGTVGGSLIAIENSQVTISGGTFNSIISAGWHYYGWDVYDKTVITLIGSDFSINGNPASYGQYSTSDFSVGHITGTLKSGDILNNEFRIQDGSKIILAPIPEPASVLLMLLGAASVRAKRRH